jgi:hypothetical protein
MNDMDAGQMLRKMDRKVEVAVPAILIASYMESKNYNCPMVEVDVDAGGVRPVGIRDLYGTEAVDGPSKTFDDRITRCYEISNYALLFGTAPSIARLIHGSIHGQDAPERIGHAWLVITTRVVDLVWEPITGLVHLKDEWYEFARARDEREYLKHVAARTTQMTGHYGRWHDSRYP